MKKSPKQPDKNPELYPNLTITFSGPPGVGKNDAKKIAKLALRMNGYVIQKDSQENPCVLWCKLARTPFK